jgi:hypothetical protein
MNRVVARPIVVFPAQFVEREFEMFLDSTCGSDLSAMSSMKITSQPWGLTGTIGIVPGAGWWVLVRSVEGTVLAQSELPPNGEPFVAVVAPSQLAGGWIEVTRNQLHLIDEHGGEPTGEHLRWRRQLRFSLAKVRSALEEGVDDRSIGLQDVHRHLARIRSCAHLARIDVEQANDLVTVLSGVLQGRSQRRCRVVPSVADLLVPVGWQSEHDPLGRHLVVR